MSPINKAKKIKLVIFDVDGIMTDGGIIYTNDGQEIKQFNVLDGLGIKMLQKAGIETAIITGRESRIVEHRAQELGISHLFQGREDKLSASLSLLRELRLSEEEAAYMGDDLPDLSAIKQLGLGITVANASSYIQQHADFICERTGGNAAVREACEFILESQGKLNSIIESFLVKTS